MKPLTISELELLAEDLRTLVGGQVQKVMGSSNEFGLALWKSGKLNWIWVVLDKKTPLLLLLDEPRRLKKITTPLQLFLNAHFGEKKLTAVEFDPHLGRVLSLAFSDAKLEVRLFPHGVNLIATCGRGRVAWAKVQELPVGKSDFIYDENPRTPRQVYLEWSAQKPKAEKILDIEAWRQSEKQRLEKSLQKLAADILEKKAKLWRPLGDWLKENQSLEVPDDFAAFVDKKKTVSWNMQNCFAKAKDLDEKIKRAENRRQEILLAIEALPKKTPTEKLPPVKLKERVEQRTLRLENNVTASFGKSASDNLKLLRSAKAWHLWLHLKDYPGAHGIVYFDRSLKVADSDLYKIASWLINETLGRKKNLGGTFEVLVTECRFVTPIKGDSLGRVNYRNERVIRVRIDDQK